MKLEKELPFTQKQLQMETLIIKRKKKNALNYNLVLNKVKELAFNALFEQMPVTFYWLDKDGYCVGCNQEELTLLGLDSITQFIGKHASELFAEHAWLNSQKVLREKKVQQFEEFCPFPDGSKKYFYTIKAPVFDEGEVVGLIGLSLDITDKKKAELAKTEFLENMSHDLRTPFSGIISLSEYLYTQENNPMKKELLGEILNSGQQLLGLLNDVLDLARQGGHPLIITEFNLIEVIQEVLGLLHAEARHKGLDVNVSCPFIAIRSDRMRINRILLNLIANAITYTLKGCINIRVNTEPTFTIDIEDTGEGIPADAIDNIFERFTKLHSSYKQQKFTGAGLGLHIAREFARDLGGDITVKSTVGEGSCFTLLLPNTLI